MMGGARRFEFHQDVLGGRLDQLRHLPLGQPDRLAGEPDIHPGFAVRGFVDDQLIWARELGVAAWAT